MLDPSISTFLITIINIAILFVILRKLLFKRVTQFMDARVNKIQCSIDEAEKSREEAKALLKKYEEQLKNAQEESENIILAARKQAQKEADKIVANGLRTAETLVASAHRQIEADREAAMALFRSEATALVISASSKLLQRELTQEDNHRFVGLLLQEIRK